MQTKERIFEAALNLFSRKGFSATSVRDITGQAGVTPGSLYNHFASKDDLLQSVYDYYTNLLVGTQTEPDYEHLLKEYGVPGVFEYLTKSYIHAMRNKKLMQLTNIILMEQYTHPVAADIACKDRQRLITFMENLFVVMNDLGYIQVSDPGSWGRLLAYVYLGFVSDNLYEYKIKKTDPDEIAARQYETIRKFVNDIPKAK